MSKVSPATSMLSTFLYNTPQHQPTKKISFFHKIAKLIQNANPEKTLITPIQLGNPNRADYSNYFTQNNVCNNLPIEFANSMQVGCNKYRQI